MKLSRVTKTIIELDENDVRQALLEFAARKHGKQILSASCVVQPVCEDYEECTGEAMATIEYHEVKEG